MSDDRYIKAKPRTPHPKSLYLIPDTPGHTFEYTLKSEHTILEEKAIEDYHFNINLAIILGSIAFVILIMILIAIKYRQKFKTRKRVKKLPNKRQVSRIDKDDEVEIEMEKKESPTTVSSTVSSTSTSLTAHIKDHKVSSGSPGPSGPNGSNGPFGYFDKDGQFDKKDSKARTQTRNNSSPSPSTDCKDQVSNGPNGPGRFLDQGGHGQCDEKDQGYSNSNSPISKAFEIPTRTCPSTDTTTDIRDQVSNSATRTGHKKRSSRSRSSSSRSSKRHAPPPPVPPRQVPNSNSNSNHDDLPLNDNDGHNWSNCNYSTCSDDSGSPLRFSQNQQQQPNTAVPMTWRENLDEIPDPVNVHQRSMGGFSHLMDYSEAPTLQLPSRNMTTTKISRSAANFDVPSSSGGRIHIHHEEIETCQQTTNCTNGNEYSAQTGYSFRIQAYKHEHDTHNYN